MGAGPHAEAAQTAPGLLVLHRARAPEKQRHSPRAKTARGEQRRIYSPPTASGTYAEHIGESPPEKQAQESRQSFGSRVTSLCCPHLCRRRLPGHLVKSGFACARRKGKNYCRNERPSSETTGSLPVNVRTRLSRHATQNRPRRRDCCHRFWPLALLQPFRVKCSLT
jgi:hypothetical protein